MSGTAKEQHAAILSDKIETPLKGKSFELFGMSTKRLIVLMVLTFGLYSLYWAYKNWEYINRTLPEDNKVWPFPRALFALFFTHSLFKQILNTAKTQGFTKNYSAGGLAVLYLVCAYLSNGIAKIDTFDYRISALALALLIIGTIPMALMQQAINFNNSKLNGGKDVKSKSSIGEKVYITIVVVLGLLIYVGYFVPTDKTQSSTTDTSAPQFTGEYDQCMVDIQNKYATADLADQQIAGQFAADRTTCEQLPQ